MKQYIRKNREKIKKATPLALIAVVFGGMIHPFLGFFMLGCMLLAIGIAFFDGRKWCDYCPRGNILDKIIKPVSQEKEIPPILKSWKVRILAIAFLMGVVLIQVTLKWPNLEAIGSFFVLLLGISTGFAILIGIAIHPRTFCRICPMGSMANLIGGDEKALEIEEKECTDCGICEEICPMQLKSDELRDCIKCKECVLSCPTGAISQ